MANDFKKFNSLHKINYSKELNIKDIKYIEKVFEADYATFLQEQGFAGYDDGLFWTVDPREYEITIKEFKLNPDIVKVLVRTAFGDLIITDGSGVYFLYTSYNERYQFSSSINNLFNLFLCTKKFIKKELRGEIFNTVLKKLGKLQSDECYGYIPALPLGGSDSIENLRILKVKEYLSILAQAQN